MATRHKYGVPATRAPTPPEQAQASSSVAHAADEYELQPTPAETRSIEPPPSYHSHINTNHDPETAIPPPPPPDADIADMGAPPGTPLPAYEPATSYTANQHTTGTGTSASASPTQTQPTPPRERLGPAGRICSTLVVLVTFFLLGLGVLVAFAFFISLIVYQNRVSTNNSGEFYRFVAYMVMVEGAVVFAAWAVYTSFRRGLH